MRLSIQFSMVLLPLIIMATNIAPVHGQSMKSITQEFKELAAATHKLSQWNPNGLSNPEADATALGKKLDETTKAMQQHGPLNESDAQSVSTSLGQMSNDIKTLGANVKSGATLFAISGQTKKVVGGMQTYGNNFATLFSITENDMPSDQLSMVRGYDATSICAIDDAIKSLDSSACQPQGQAYCDSLNNKQPQAIDLSKNCPNPQVNAANFMNLHM